MSTLVELHAGPASQISPFYNMTEGNSFEVVLALIDNATGIEVTGAEASYTIYLNDLVVQGGSLIENLPGAYYANITVPMASVTAYSLVITSSKVHCWDFELEVLLVSHVLKMRSEMNSVMLPETAFEDEIYTLSLELVDIETQSKITGATVLVTLRQPDGELYWREHAVEMEGAYVLNITIPTALDEAYHLIIDVSKEHYEPLRYEQVLVSKVDTEKMFQEMIGAVSSGIVLLSAAAVALGFAFGGYRLQKKRRAHRALETIAYKSRLHDAKNIIGVIILMRKSGIPIYSRTVRGVFEESILSGFISAITSFRMELQDKVKLWTPLPISDIVTAVQTKSLVCALMTFNPPSDEQVARLLSFARAVGKAYDKEFKKPSGFETEDEIVEGIDNLVSDHLDVAVLRKYISLCEPVSEKGIEKLIPIMDNVDPNEGITPEEIIGILLSAGTTEYHAYGQVMHAVDSHYLVELIDESDDEDEIDDEIHEEIAPKKKVKR
jgi:hypothetical protein